MHTDDRNLEALVRPNSHFAISGNSLWKQHAFGVVNSWLHLILFGPRDRGLEKTQVENTSEHVAAAKLFSKQTVSDLWLARSLGSASWRARECMSNDSSVHWRSAVGSDWTETLGILPGCRKSAIATTARTYELSYPVERPAAHHTQAIAVDWIHRRSVLENVVASLPNVIGRIKAHFARVPEHVE